MRLLPTLSPPIVQRTKERRVGKVLRERRVRGGCGLATRTTCLGKVTAGPQGASSVIKLAWLWRSSAYCFSSSRLHFDHPGACLGASPIARLTVGIWRPEHPNGKRSRRHLGLLVSVSPTRLGRCGVCAHCPGLTTFCKQSSDHSLVTPCG